MQLQGSPLNPASPRDAIRRGIGLVPEDRRLEGLMMSMSVPRTARWRCLPRMQTLGFIRRRQEIAELGADRAATGPQLPLARSAGQPA